MMRLLVVWATASSLGALAPAHAAAVEPGGNAPNQPPVARVTKDFVRGREPLKVCFDASKSFDPEGKPLTFRWDFGDGTGTGTTAQACHVYQQAGLYAGTVTVTDDLGLTGSATVVVAVSQAARGS